MGWRGSFDEIDDSKYERSSSRQGTRITSIQSVLGVLFQIRNKIYVYLEILQYKSWKKIALWKMITNHFKNEIVYFMKDISPHCVVDNININIHKSVLPLSSGATLQ